MVDVVEAGEQLILVGSRVGVSAAVGTAGVCRVVSGGSGGDRGDVAVVVAAVVLPGGSGDKRKGPWLVAAVCCCCVWLSELTPAAWRRVQWCSASVEEGGL